MLKLRYRTEDWRDHAVELNPTDSTPEPFIDDDELADELRKLTLNRLMDARIEFQSAPHQTVGNSVIIQHADTQAERDAFDAAMESAKFELRVMLASNDARFH